MKKKYATHIDCTVKCDLYIKCFDIFTTIEFCFSFNNNIRFKGHFIKVLICYKLNTFDEC